MAAPENLRPVQITVQPDLTAPLATQGDSIIGWYGSLPQGVDDAERLIPGLYEKMLADPMVQGVLINIIASVADAPLTAYPCYEITPDQVNVTPEDERRAERSREMAEFVNANFQRLASVGQSIDDTVKDLLRCIAFGHRAAEVTLAQVGGQLLLDSVTVLNRSSYAFALDQGNRLGGLILKAPGKSLALRSGPLGDPNQIPNFVPKPKALLVTLLPENNHPRGTSLLRGCYSPWRMSQQARVDLNRFSSQAGGSILDYVLPLQAQSVQDENGVEISPQKQAEKVLAQVASGKGMVRPAGSEFSIKNPTSKHESFIDSLEMYRKEIVQAITGTARHFVEAQHGSKADSGESVDMFDRFKRMLQGLICSAIRHQLCATLIGVNFGQEALEFLPHVSIGEANRADFSRDADGVAKLLPQCPEPMKPQLWRKIGLTYIPGEATPSPEDDSDA